MAVFLHNNAGDGLAWRARSIGGKPQSAPAREILH